MLAAKCSWQYETLFSKDESLRAGDGSTSDMYGQKAFYLKSKQGECVIFPCPTTHSLECQECKDTRVMVRLPMPATKTSMAPTAL